MPAVQTNNPVSTLTTQILIDYARAYSWTRPTLGVAGYSAQPALSFVNHVIQHILSKSNPWKFNAAKMPVIETQPYQQDFPTSISMSVMGWLQAGVVVDINNPQVNVAPNQQNYFTTIPIRCVTALLPTMNCGIPQQICWVPNAIAQTGQWPGPNVVYQQPLISLGGGPGTNPLTAIRDPNGNIQVVTTYGVTGASQPTWPVAGASPGTTTQDGTVVWTLTDPLGIAIRVDQMATFNSNVYEIRLVYQLKPPRITDLKQTLAPIPDDLQYLVEQGFLAYCYKNVDHDKFQIELQQFILNIQEALGSADRESQEFGFYPDRPIQGGGIGNTGGYGYPGWLGWTSGG